MLVARTDQLQFLPDVPELIWGLSAAGLLVAPIVVAVAVIAAVAAGARRTSARLRALEARVERLESSPAPAPGPPER